MHRTKATSSILLLLVGAGCSGESGDAQQAGPSDTPTPSIATPAAPSSPRNTDAVKASIPLGDGHVLEFVEAAPGILGTIETGRENLDAPAVTEDLKKLNLVDLYRHFAGKSAEVPPALIRAVAQIGEPVPNASVPPPDRMGSGVGPEFDTSSEQSWFRNQFCNGAQNCVQGWDWAVETSYWAVKNASAVSMVGSEGATNANFTAYYYDCRCLSPFCIGGQQCYWIQFWQVLVVPGHWVSNNFSASNSVYFQWDLTGGGSNTQVSMAANYNAN